MTDYRRLFYKASGARDGLEKQAKIAKTALAEADRRLADIEKAQVFLQKTAQDTQSRLKVHIEDIVQLALDAVFPDVFIFSVDFTSAYGKTAAVLVFQDKATGYTVDPLAASGGGVVDICAFALRLACWSLSRNSDSVLVWDEPFRFVSRDLQAAAGSLLRELSEKLGVQIILTTHLQPLVDAADSVIHISRGADGVSTA
jgi:DNA repair exonuclease SbcCD ATPase subunit